MAITAAQAAQAAQKVQKAYDFAPFEDFDIGDRKALAAAIRVLLDIVVPEENVDEADYDSLHMKHVAEGKQELRQDTLAIVSEIEKVRV